MVDGESNRPPNGDEHRAKQVQIIFMGITHVLNQNRLPKLTPCQARTESVPGVLCAPWQKRKHKILVAQRWNRTVPRINLIAFAQPRQTHAPSHTNTPRTGKFIVLGASFLAESIPSAHRSGTLGAQSNRWRGPFFDLIPMKNRVSSVRRPG